MFPSQFTSAIIAVFTAIIGFYVTTVIEEIRSGSAVIYSVEKKHGEAVLFLKNASRDGALQDLHVGMSCADFSEQRTCFPTPPTEREVSITKFAPVAGEVAAPNSTPLSLEFRATLVAGASIKVTVAANSENSSDLLFVYFPQTKVSSSTNHDITLVDAIIGALQRPSTDEETPVFLRRGSITALFVEYYFSIMALVMIVTSILLLASLGWWTYDSISQAFKPPEKPESEPQKFVVDLSVSGRKPSL